MEGLGDGIGARSGGFVRGHGWLLRRDGIGVCLWGVCGFIFYKPLHLDDLGIQFLSRHCFLDSAPVWL